VRSYLLIRAVVGILGIVLPFVLIFGEWFFLRGSAAVRGSLSAYYHSSMGDFFVGALCVVAFLLLMYMSGQKRTPDFVLSSIAGVALLGLVFLPARRPGVTDAGPLCGPDVAPQPSGCSPFPSAFGENFVSALHASWAAIFILSLAGICFAFSRRDRDKRKLSRRARLHFVCAVIIIVAVFGVVVGSLLDARIFGLTPLYLGEVISVWAFGVSWFAAGEGWRLIRGKPYEPDPSGSPSPPRSAERADVSRPWTQR
jgi:cytochrome bd-type quinol oxidase subunit 2